MKVNGNITPSLHPEMVTGVKGYGETTKQYLAETRNTLETTYKALEEIYKARDAINGDPLLSEGAKKVKLAKLAESKQKQATTAFDNTMAVLRSRITFIENAMNGPLLQNAGAGSFNEEIRRHVNDLPFEDKEKFLKDALKSKVELTLTAVLGAPAYLTGLLPVLHEGFRSQYHGMKYPGLMEELEVTKGAYDLLTKHGPKVFGEVEKAMGFKFAEAAKIQAASDRSTRALSEVT